MPSQIEALGLSHLNSRERLALIDELWDSVNQDPATDVPELCDEAKAEITRRLEAHAADPSRAIPWEEVKAKTLARLRNK
jgi:putative addiction module component (TIGR02574 family)